MLLKWLLITYYYIYKFMYYSILITEAFISFSILFSLLMEIEKRLFAIDGN